MSTKQYNEVVTRRQPSKNRPVKMSNHATHRDVSLPSRKTRKSTQAAKLETLRRRTVRSEKYGSAK